MSDTAATPAATPSAPATNGAPAAAETPAAAVPPAVDYDRKISTLSTRLQEQERGNLRLNKQLKELQAVKEKYETTEKRLAEDPFGLLEERGHTYDKWTGKIMSGGKKADPVDEKLSPAMKKIEELQAKLEAREQSEQTEALSREQAQAVKAINESLAARGEFPSTVALGQGELLYRRLKTFADEHGECPPHEQERIARELESEIDNTVTAQLNELVKVPKFREQLAKLIASAAPAEGAQSDTEKTPSDTGRKPVSTTAASGKTITQSQVSSVVDRIAEKSGVRSREDRRSAALARLK